MRKTIVIILLTLVIFSLMIPNTSAIIFGSYPPLPYWHGSVGNHTVWTDGSYPNVNVTNDMNASYFYGNGSHITGINIGTGTNLGASLPIVLTGNTLSHSTADGYIHIPSGGVLNHILKNSGVAGTGSWGTMTENSGAVNGITTLGMSNQLTNTLADGTAPFVITSTTVSTNLNADLHDGKHVGTSGNTIPLLDGTNTWSGVQTIGASSGITFASGINIIFSATTGTKIGTATNQKTGFFGATPIIQPLFTADLIDSLQALGLLSIGAGDTPLDLTSGGISCGKLTCKSSLSATTGGFSDDITTTSATPSVFLVDNDIGHDDYSINAQTGIFTIRNDVDSVNALCVAGTGGITFNAGADNTYTLTDAENFVLGSTTGNQIGSSNSQKLGFWGVAPVTQPVNTVALDTLLVNLGLRASGGTATFDTDIKTTTAGKGLYIKEGANACMGTATLVAGTVTVATTKVTANSRIFLTVQSLGTVAIPTAIAVTARVAATSFTITSAAVTDTSVVAWMIVEPG